MGRTLEEMLKSLPAEQRAATERRAEELIAEELSLRADISAGMKQLEESKSSPLDDTAVERIKRRGRVRLAELKGAKR